MAKRKRKNIEMLKSYLEEADEVADLIKRISKCRYREKKGRRTLVCVPPHKLSDDKVREAASAYVMLNEVLTRYKEAGGELDDELRERYEAVLKVGRKIETFREEVLEETEEAELVENDTDESETQLPESEPEYQTSSEPETGPDYQEAVTVTAENPRTDYQESATEGKEHSESEWSTEMRKENEEFWEWMEGMRKRLEMIKERSRERDRRLKKLDS